MSFFIPMPNYFEKIVPFMYVGKSSLELLAVFSIFLFWEDLAFLFEFSLWFFEDSVWEMDIFLSCGFLQ